MIITNSDYCKIRSNNQELIGINGMGISKYINKTDIAYFSRSYWSGFLEGTDGYPTTDGHGGYYIAGGNID